MGKAFLVLLFFFSVSIGFSEQSRFIKLDSESCFSIDTAGIPLEALPAIDYSFKLLDSVLFTDVPIRVSINFSTTSRKEVIATGVATSYEIGFSDLASPNFFYPISLAEKISGVELNDTDKADINVIVNKELDWFFDISSVNVGNRFDFITLLTHELIHGLGFQSMIRVFSGSVDTSATPSIFDSFIVDTKNIPLFPDYFKNGPESVQKLITSDSLFFYSSYFKTLFAKSRVQLYSPKQYAAGNSIHHLIFQTDSLPPFRIMRPGFRYGEYQRYIDPYTKYILHAMGWNRPSIQLEKLYDIDSINADQVLKLKIPIAFPDLQIEYSFDKFNHFKTVTPTCLSGVCSAVIPSLEFDHTVDYRLKYTDEPFGSVTLPCENCSISYYVGDDTVKPNLSNFVLPTIFVDTKQILVKYNVSDNSGATEVCFVVTLKGQVVDSICTSYNQNQSINFSYGLPTISENDTLHFTLSVTDRSKRKNKFFLEKNIVVLKTGDIKYSYSTDFDDTNVNNDFSLNGFTIGKNVGFNSNSLDSKHFYIAPNIDQDTLFTSAILKPRIIIDSVNYFMTFDEIVLVEPCEPGKRFGEFGFWDFVSVEGSKDNGQTWHIFGKEGYDATYNEIWHLAYLNNIILSGRNKNSLTVPTVDMYRTHKINLVENKYLHKGDTVMIRFLLTSDAFSTGWGWSIDNLEIQKGAGVKVTESELKLEVYPNPFLSEISFATPLNNSKYKIVTIEGEIVQSGHISGTSINVKPIPEGLYILVIEMNGIVYSRTIAKQAN